MKETSRRRLVEVPDGVWDDLKAWAGSQGRPMCDVVSGALQAFLEGVEGGGNANGGGVAGRAEGEPEGAEVTEHTGRSKKGRTTRVGKSSRETGRRVLSTRSTNRVRQDTGKPSSVKGVKRGQSQQQKVDKKSTTRHQDVQSQVVQHDGLVGRSVAEASQNVLPDRAATSGDCVRCGHARIRHVFGSTKTRCDCLTCPVFVAPLDSVEPFLPEEFVVEFSSSEGVPREQVEEATDQGVQGVVERSNGARHETPAIRQTVVDDSRRDRAVDPGSLGSAVDDGLDF